MDLVVTDLVQQHRRPALPAAQLGRQMVQALRRAGQDGSFAQGTDGVFVGHFL